MADFYLRTAASLDKVIANTQSVKAAAAPHHDSKRVLALLVNTLAYRAPLTQVLDQVKVAQLERKAFPKHADQSSRTAKEGKEGKALKQASKAKAATAKQNVQRPAPGNGRSALGKPAPPSRSDPPSTASLLLVLSHDLLFSSRGIQAAKAWPPKVAIERHRARLHSELVKLQLRAGKSRIQDLRAGALADSEDGRSFDEIIRTIPRWARINELKTTIGHVRAWLLERGWKEVGEDAQRVELKASNEFAVSAHIPSLLAFPPKSTSTLLASELYRDGLVVLQDLASCMPAQILNPLEWEAKPSGSTGSQAGGSGKRKRKRDAALGAIDATSAPGNKTSHLSALMQGQGHLTAFERSAPRYKTLTKLLGRAGALASSSTSDKGKSKDKSLGNVTTFNQDFLETDPEDASWQDVRYMLVDPSCSGSGIVNRLDYLKVDDEDDEMDEADEPEDQEPESAAQQVDGDAEDVTQEGAQAAPKSKKQRRLEKLAEFQLLMIRHAMRFPNLQRLVYSTCSVHAEENEHVVMRALNCAEAQAHGWKLAPRSEVLPTWSVRGRPEECDGDAKIADSVIRCTPGGTPFAEGHYPNTESCNGFFVACFTKSVDAAEDAGLQKQPMQADPQEQTNDGDEVTLEDEDEEARRKRRKTEQNRKKAEQKKRREKEKKAALQPQQS